MATKAGLISSINGFITAIVTVLKTRNAFSSVVDELYPLAVTDNSTSQTYTTRANIDIPYTINIVKSGNIAHITGTIQNTLPYVLGQQNIFLWKESVYKPINGTEIRFFATNDFNGTQLHCYLTNNVFAILEPLPSDATYYFDFKTYITQD